MARRNANANAEFELWEFQPKDVKIGNRLGFIGMTGSGKSVAMQSIIMTMKDKCFGAFAHAYTDDVQQFWRKFIPESYVYSNRKDLERLKAVYMAQKELVSAYKRLVELGMIDLEEAKQKCHLIIVLDDLMFLGNKVFKDELIREIWCNGRHQWITVMLSLQYAKGIDPTLRGQIDWAFLWKVSKPNERKKIYEEWVGYFDNFKEFDRAFNQTTDTAYQCMVVRNSPAGNNSLKDNVTFYLPELPPKFTVGCKAFQAFHQGIVEEKKRQGTISHIDPRKKMKVA